MALSRRKRGELRHCITRKEHQRTQNNEINISETVHNLLLLGRNAALNMEHQVQQSWLLIPLFCRLLGVLGLNMSKPWAKARGTESITFSAHSD